MEAFMLALLLLAAVLLSAVIDQIAPHVPACLIQIGLGLLISLSAGGIVDIDLDSELFLVLFIAPLLYDEARNADKAALWQNRTPILSLAIGLVIAVMLVVGFTLHWLVPSIPLTAAFALGAALGPTDAVAVASLPKGAKMSERQRSLLKGEYLINDASGIVSFQFAVAATVTGSFSVLDATASFLLSFFGAIVFGVLIGWLLGWLAEKVRSLGLNTTTFHVLYDVCTPFIVFLAAEAIGVSGIIAVVCAGLAISVTRRSIGPAISRQNIVSGSVWRVISFALNGIVFVLLGTQLPKAMYSTWDNVSISNWALIGWIVAITIVLLGIRFLWMLALEWRRSKREGERLSKDGYVGVLLMTLAGAKGTITLSIMFTLPVVMSNGSFFPFRDLLIFLACGVILLTLVASNLIIPLFTPKELDEEAEARRAHEVEAYIEILRSVVENLTAHQTAENRREVAIVVGQYNERIARVKETNDLEDDDADMVRLRLLALGWEREITEELIAKGAVTELAGADYLERIEKTEQLLRHSSRRFGPGLYRMRLRALLNDVRNGFVDGVPFVSETERYANQREVQLQVSRKIVRRLQDSISEIYAPSEKVAVLIREYARLARSLSHSNPSLTQAARAVGNVEEIQAYAYELELEAIQEAYEADDISRGHANRLRDNVNLMKADLENRV